MKASAVSFTCLALFVLSRNHHAAARTLCTDGEVRLEDKESEYVGRVGLCYRGEWGSVFDYEINDNAAAVVCRQLGLPEHDPKVILQYAGAKGRVHFYHVDCVGNEATLLECRTDISGYIGPGSWYGRDIGVSCAPECAEGDVRLLRDRVQICENKRWGYVCYDNGWTHRDAQVVCTQLGLHSEDVLVDYHIFVFGQHTFPYFVNMTNCNGSEDYLLDCQDVNETVLCGSVTVAKVYCSGMEQCNATETIRLTEISVDRKNYGRLEICHDGYWGSVCDDSLHHSKVLPSPLVACRELGYTNVLEAEFTPIGRTEYVLPSIPIVLDDLRCAGDEITLLDCPKNTDQHNCINWEDVVLNCRVKECNETDVHLVGEKSSPIGRVEICRNGLWVPVCGIGWDYREAEVTCRQLGYRDGGSYAIEENLHQSSIKISECSGNETSLIACHCVKLEETSCESRAAVVCTDSACEEGSVRLVGGHSVKEGRVQICYSGQWYLVCADNWSKSGAEGKVICSQLGHLGDSVTADFGKEQTPFSPFYIGCNGSERSINMCSKQRNVVECEVAAGVICDAHCTLENVSSCNKCSGPSNKCLINDECFCSAECLTSGLCCPDVEKFLYCLERDGCDTGDVRLTGGTSGSSSGVVEVCVNGVWGTICDYKNVWSDNNTAVVCNQLNLPSSSASVLSSSVFGSVSSLPVLFESVHCTGTENTLLDCPHTSVGNHFCNIENPEIIAIQCKADCEDGEVRLADGTHYTNGRVEICLSGIWSSVCSDDKWDVVDASVVCKELGFQTTDAVVEVTEVFGKGGLTMMSGVECNGSETELHLCHSNRSDGAICDHASAGLICNREYNIIQKCNVERNISYKTNKRIGVCEPYSANCKLCNGVFRESLDYVFIAAIHGSQKNVSSLLDNKHPPYLERNANADGENCYENVVHVICNYYMGPCVNHSSQLIPTSICPEDCSAVERDCPTAWTTVQHALDEYHFISCSDTSRFIFPLLSCCSSTVIEKGGEVPTSGSADKNNAGGVTAGGVLSTLLILATTVTAMIITACIYRRWRWKQEKVKKLQMDIMTGSEQEQVATAIEMNRLDGIGTKPISNPYAEVQPALREDSALKFENKRTRLNSCHLRELQCGKFLVKGEEIFELQNIGQGEFGVVYKAKWGPRGRFSRVVAVKTLKGNFDQAEVDKFVEESLKMSRFKHPHVMGLIGVCLDSGSAPYIIMPYMANGSLLDYLKQERCRIVLSDNADEDQMQEVQKHLMVMCCQIASGMEYLATEKYVHRDMAARNCMIDSHFVIKISDFGLSEDVFQRNYYREGVDGEMAKLPFKWMAPESLSDGHFSEKSDVWSFGVTMWEIFSGGKSPYPGTNPVSLMQMLEEGERMPKPYNAACSDEIYMMMLRCWESMPDKRPSFKTLYTGTSKFIEGIAGYLEMGFNPFTAGGESSTGKGEESTPERSENEEEPPVT